MGAKIAKKSIKYVQKHANVKVLFVLLCVYVCLCICGACGYVRVYVLFFFLSFFFFFFFFFTEVAVIYFD